MTSMRSRGWMMAAVMALAFTGCGDDGSGGGSGGTGAGVATPPQWNSTANTGTSGTNDTPLLWNDPNSGEGGNNPTTRDTTDVRTYTAPDIYILGNKHPLMTEVTTSTHPTIILQENRLTTLLSDFRYAEYVRLIGSPLPNNARLIEFLPLRQSARAHAKHYAIHHIDVPLPLVNAEGDNVGGFGTHVNPNTSRFPGSQGRLGKAFVEAEVVGHLVCSGPSFGMPDSVATYWINNFPDFLRLPDWTHFGIGYWPGPGSSEVYYWNAVFARNPRMIVTTPPNPFPFF